ncbi:RNA polymerase sigma-70 like domain, partial [uncultured Caudovirales phage]
MAFITEADAFRRPADPAVSPASTPAAPVKLGNFITEEEATGIPATPSMFAGVIEQAGALARRVGQDVRNISRPYGSVLFDNPMTPPQKFDTDPAANRFYRDRSVSPGSVMFTQTQQADTRAAVLKDIANAPPAPPSFIANPKKYVEGLTLGTIGQLSDMFTSIPKSVLGSAVYNYSRIYDELFTAKTRGESLKSSQALKDAWPQELNAPWSVVAKAMGPDAQYYYANNPVAFVMEHIGKGIETAAGGAASVSNVPVGDIMNLADATMGWLGVAGVKGGVARSVKGRTAQLRGALAPRAPVVPGGEGPMLLGELAPEGPAAPAAPAPGMGARVRGAVAGLREDFREAYTMGTDAVAAAAEAVAASKARIAALTPETPIDLTEPLPAAPTKAELKAQTDAVNSLVVDKAKLQEILGIATKKGPAAEAALVQNIFDRVMQPVRRVEPPGVIPREAWMVQRALPEEGTRQTPALFNPPPVQAPASLPRALEANTAAIAAGLADIKTPKAAKALTVDAAKGVILGPDGKLLSQRGSVDPSLLKVLALMGLGGVAAKQIYDWWNSPSGLSNDNARDLGLEGLGAMAMKGKGGMWNPRGIDRLAGRLADTLTGAQARFGAGNAAVMTPVEMASRPDIQWANNAVRKWFNKEAGTATDRLKDVTLPDGTRWEDATDQAFGMRPAKDYGKGGSQSAIPGLNKLREEGKVLPDEPVYDLGGDVFAKQYGHKGEAVGSMVEKLQDYMGHVGEYLRSLNLAPEKLQQYDLVRAVTETKAWDVRMAKQAEKAAVREADVALQRMKSMETVMDFPDTGMRLVKLDKPGDFAHESTVMGHSVRGYEPHGKLYHDGHPKDTPENGPHPDWTPESEKGMDKAQFNSGDPDYGLGGWEAVKSGAAEVLSLRDAKGESHVTIEIEAGKTNWATGEPHPSYPSRVLQIKGKGNAPVAERYQQQIADFLNSRSFGRVGDLQNAGIVKYGDKFITQASVIDRFADVRKAFETTDVAKALREASRKDDWTEFDQLRRQTVEIPGDSGRRSQTYDVNEVAGVLSDPAAYDLQNSPNLLDNMRTAVNQLLAAEGKPPVEIRFDGGKQRGSVKPEQLAMLAGGAAAAAYLANDTDPDKLATLAAALGAGIISPRGGKLVGLPEAKLIETFRAGGREGEAAAAQIWETTNKQLGRTIGNMNRQLDEAGIQDISQRVYEKVFKALKQSPDEPGGFRGEAKLSTFLHGVASNEVKNAFATASRRPATDSMTVDAEGMTSVPEKYMMEQNPEKYQSAEDIAANNKLAQHMQTALDKLPEDSRAIFEAIEMEGLSYQEAADRFGIPIGTVRSRVSRAKDALGQSLRQYRNQGGKIDADSLIALSALSTGVALGAYLDSDNPIRGGVLGAIGVTGFGALVKGKSGKAGAANNLEYALGLVSTQLGGISQPLLRRARDYERFVMERTDKALDAVTPFIKGVKKLPTAAADALNLALLRGYPGEIATAIQGNPALVAGYRQVRNLLDAFRAEQLSMGRFAAGVNEYFPRVVKDLEGLKEALNQPMRTHLETLLAKAEADMIKTRGRGMTDIERSLIVNRALQTSAPNAALPGFARARSVDITADLAPFYLTPTESLLRYIVGAVEDAEVAKFFGKDLASKKLANGQVATHVDNSIGNLIQSEMKAGQISPDQQLRIKSLLESRFKAGEQQMGGFLQDVRNATNLGLLGNFASAVTQIGDSVMTAYHHDLMPTLGALRMKLTGSSQITPKEFGLVNHIAEEMASTRLSGKAVQTLFKYTGFSALDQFAKGLNLQAGLIKNQKLAQTAKGQAVLAERWGQAFGTEFPQLLSDLAAKRMSEPVKSLLFSELSNAQPITKLEVPQAYLDHPNGRILYQMKTYMLKQIDVVRRDAYQEIAKGNYVKGARNLVGLATALSLANIPGDVIKDVLSGRPIRLDKIDYVENLLQNFGINHYTMGKINRETLAKGIKEFAVGTVTPPSLSMLSDLDKPEKLIKYIPGVGRPLYDREFGGNEARKWAELVQAKRAERDRLEAASPALKDERLRK